MLFMAELSCAQFYVRKYTFWTISALLQDLLRKLNCPVRCLLINQSSKELGDGEYN
jgi:hypothetical protein